MSNYFNKNIFALLLATSMAFASSAFAQGRRAQGTTAAVDGPGETSPVGVVNIQTASEEELMRLPSIGPSKAQAILAQRQRAPFRRVEDILRVRGIGRGIFRRLRPMLSVQGSTTLPAPAARTRRPRTEGGSAQAMTESRTQSAVAQTPRLQMPDANEGDDNVDF